ncbi:hypothetical protein ACEYYB_05350 [Paracoccus sp. p4-l81]|uniref:hypothetical protein n=1 Tax=unclassified Paracoccus (in: a-proteobacteria) TaxID=2688777 RepID=UPI0035BB6054
MRHLTTLTLIAGLALPSLALAETFQIGIHNEGDEPIVAVHVVDLDGAEYADLLGGAEIDPGDSTTLAIETEAEDCEGDLIVDFADGSRDSVEDANLCDDDDYSFDN